VVDRAEQAETPGVARVVDLVTLQVARARQGDVQAWARLYQDHFDSVFRHLRYLTGDSSVAEDLTQETFAQALVSLERFEARATFSTWLHRIGIMLARKHWRWQRNTAKATGGLALVPGVALGSGGEDPEAQSQRHARTQALYSVLAQMPETLREVFVLRDLEQLSQRDVAERLDISENNAGVRATRARAHVRRELTRLGWLEDAR